MSKLNPNAKPFVMNPKAQSFVPRAMQQPQQQPQQQWGQQMPQFYGQPQPRNQPQFQPQQGWQQPQQPQQQTLPQAQQPQQAQQQPKKPTEVKQSSPQAKPKQAKKQSKPEPAKQPPQPAKEQPKEPTKDQEPPKPKPKKKPVNTEDLKSHDSREHLNVVFIGHVDAGKSTISGQILLQTGQVDQRTIEKYQREAKDNNRDSWYLAFIMDTNEEERAKGKTVECGRAHFATVKKRFTLLDAPGHKNYVPNMIGGAAQADVAVLIISARKGEFETGFERGGQTREHTMLCRTLGVTRLVVAVNKMDDPTVNWDQARFTEIEQKLRPFLKQVGFNPEEIPFVPISGYTGANIVEPLQPSVCDWYSDKSLISALESIPAIERDKNAPLRIPVVGRFKDMGLLSVQGKIEAGVLRKGDRVMCVPNSKVGEVATLEVDEKECDVAFPGENVEMQLKGIDEEDVPSGSVFGDEDVPCKQTNAFETQLVLLELLEHKPIIAAGYSCILHIHTACVECQISAFISELDKKTGKKKKGKVAFVKQGSVCKVKILTDHSIAIETFADYQQLGRFTLRDEGKTIAIGKVLKLLEPEISDA